MEGNLFGKEMASPLQSWLHLWFCALPCACVDLRDVAIVASHQVPIYAQKWPGPETMEVSVPCQRVVMWFTCMSIYTRTLYILYTSVIYIFEYDIFIWTYVDTGTRDQGPKTIRKGLPQAQKYPVSRTCMKRASSHTFACKLCKVNIRVKCMWTFMHQHQPGLPHTSLTTCRCYSDLWYHHFHTSAHCGVRNFAVDITSCLIIYIYILYNKHHTIVQLCHSMSWLYYSSYNFNIYCIIFVFYMTYSIPSTSYVQ